MEAESIGSSILAKFQQISQEKELAKAALDAPTFISSTGAATTNEVNQSNEKRKRKAKFESKRSKLTNHDDLHVGLSEKDVGITEYVCNTVKGFSGIIKHRFSDFQVHEIDLEGNVIELKSIDPPTVPEGLDESAESIDKSVLSKDIWLQIGEILTSSSENAVVEIDVSDKNKTERTLIHKAIKHVYGSKLFSNTVSLEQKTLLKVGKCKSKERSSWPSNLGQFLNFTVFKENIDTTNVVSVIGQKLKIKANSITYCGTKDKRGKTTQRMCVKRRQASELHSLKFHQIKLGDYCYTNKPLRLGDLMGNKFSIAVRNVTSSDADINDSLRSIKENGFINYYGLQRFGSSLLSPTFVVGKQILLKSWLKAVEAILKPRNGEKCALGIMKARETWWTTKNAALALKSIPKHDNSIEAKVLRALKNQGNDQYFNALFAIPRNTMLLYVHAYQSLIWNKVVSKRIREYGLKPLVGDLVFDEDDCCDVNAEVIDEVKQKDVDDEEENYENQTEIDNPKEQKLTRNGAKRKTKLLTNENLAQYKIEDIVLPLPGNDIDYPNNETASWYSDFLAEDGLTLECFKNANEAFALFGTYRHMIGTVSDLSWTIVNYNNFDDDLILSDIDKLENNSLIEQPKDSKYKAVILEFKLKSSQYATMLLREIMKCETSVGYHAALTKGSHSKLEDEPNEKKLRTEQAK